MNNQKELCQPNLILENGVVFPISSLPKIGSSIAIYQNQIMAVGPQEDVARYATRATERIDLQGRSVIPGFIDCHTCFATDCRKIDQINLDNEPTSIERVREILHAGIERTAPEEWVVVTGYTEDVEKGTYPLTGEDLDRIVPDRAAVVVSANMDLCIMNRTGMDSIQIGQKAVDLTDVEVEQDRQHKATGRFYGKIGQLLPDGFPCFELSSLKRKMLKLGRDYVQQGITTLHDIDLHRAMDLAAYVSLRRESALPLRVVPLIRGFPRDDQLRQLYLKTGIGTGFGDPWLRFGAMKFSVDGLMGRQTAAISIPWKDKPNRYGQLFFSEEVLVKRICESTEAGFQVAFHANGDRAIDLVIRAIGKAKNLTSRPISRPRIHHCTLPNHEHIELIGEIGAIPIGHPHFIRFLGDKHFQSLGAERIKAGYFPFRSYLDHGIPAVLSSEPILPLDKIHPMIGISAAMSRKTLLGQVLSAEQSITLDQALRMYTFNPAWAAFEEKQKGSIEPGKLADLVVLETDIRKLSPDALAEVRVDYTILDGKIVFSRT